MAIIYVITNKEKTVTVRAKIYCIYDCFGICVKIFCLDVISSNRIAGVCDRAVGALIRKFEFKCFIFHIRIYGNCFYQFVHNTIPFIIC